jgi:hypothetical protein
MGSGEYRAELLHLGRKLIGNSEALLSGLVVAFGSRQQGKTIVGLRVPWSQTQRYCVMGLGPNEIPLAVQQDRQIIVRLGNT